MIDKNYISAKVFIMIMTIFLCLSFFNKSYGVEPDEILKDKKLELRARDISKYVR